MIVSVKTDSARATEALAARLARALRGGEEILLVGELGAGKTTLVRGLAAGLGGDPRRVSSPSYAVHHRYDDGRLVLDHFDAYFVREGEEFARAGLLDFLADRHVVVVEWADRFADRFGRQAIWVRIDVLSEQERRITLRTTQRDDLLAAAVVAEDGDGSPCG